jgi:uncharacterized membrane protein YqjE
VLAALFIGFGVVFLLIFLTVLFWDSHRLLALGLATTVLLAAGVGRHPGCDPPARRLAPVCASLAEIAQDRETLRPKE